MCSVYFAAVPLYVFGEGLAHHLRGVTPEHNAGHAAFVLPCAHSAVIEDSSIY